MKKPIAILSLLFILSHFSYAQINNFGVRIGGALPIGEFSEVVEPGLASSLYYKKIKSDAFSFGVEINYSQVQVVSANPSLEFEQAHIYGAEFFLSYILAYNEKFSLSAGPGFGLYRIQSAWTYNDDYAGTSARISAEYMLSPNVGLSFDLPITIMFNGDQTGWYADIFVPISVGGFIRILE